MFTEDISAVLVDTPAFSMGKLLSEEAKKDTLKPFLDEILEDKVTGMKIPDIESKFHLHKLYRKTTLTRNIILKYISLVLKLLGIFMKGYI